MQVDDYMYQKQQQRNRSYQVKLAQRAQAAVVLDLSDGDRRIGSPDLFAPEVDAVLAIDPKHPAVHVSRSGELAATYEPSLGYVGDMVAVS